MALSTLGPELRAMRKQRGWTLKDIASKVDDARGRSGGLDWIQRRETGGVSAEDLTVGDLWILAEVYALPVTALLMLVAS